MPALHSCQCSSDTTSTVAKAHSASQKLHGSMWEWILSVFLPGESARPRIPQTLPQSRNHDKSHCQSLRTSFTPHFLVVRSSITNRHRQRADILFNPFCQPNGGIQHQTLKDHPSLPPSKWQSGTTQREHQQDGENSYRRRTKLAFRTQRLVIGIPKHTTLRHRAGTSSAVWRNLDDKLPALHTTSPKVTNPTAIREQDMGTKAKSKQYHDNKNKVALPTLKVGDTFAIRNENKSKLSLP